jgi:hypothetical protein
MTSGLILSGTAGFEMENLLDNFAAHGGAESLETLSDMNSTEATGKATIQAQRIATF